MFANNPNTSLLDPMSEKQESNNKMGPDRKNSGIAFKYRCSVLVLALLHSHSHWMKWNKRENKKRKKMKEKGEEMTAITNKILTEEDSNKNWKKN